jgi:8-oxo-dGTP pyrophosphatase MutT (NUDIX family)
MDGSFGIIFSDNRSRVLLVKRRDMPMWVLPGGRLEKKETQEQAVIREVFEETGYGVQVVKKPANIIIQKKIKLTTYTSV